MFIVFITFTSASWAQIMYFLQDSISYPGGAAYFSFLILLGPFFVIQLLIVVLKFNYRLNISKVVPEEKTDVSNANQSKTLTARVISYAREVIDDSAFYYRTSDSKFIVCCRATNAALEPFVAVIRDFVTHSYYENWVMTLVGINTFLMTLDHYPIDTLFGNVLDLLNFLLTLCFILGKVLRL